MNDVKEQVKALIQGFMRGDQKIKQQAQQILGKLMQDSPQEFSQILQQLVQEGDPDATEFMNMLQQSQQKGTPAAAKGAKLNYIKELKGICPEGYLAKGGKCKPCEAKMKQNGGGMDPVKSFKNDRMKNPKDNEIDYNARPIAVNPHMNAIKSENKYPKDLKNIKNTNNFKRR